MNDLLMLNSKKQFNVFCRAAAHVVDIKSLYELASKQLVHIVGAQWARILLVDQIANEYEVIDLSEENITTKSKERFPLTNTSVEAVINREEPISSLTHSIDDFSDCVSLKKDTGAHFFVTTPLITLDGILGALCIFFPADTEISSDTVFWSESLGQVIASHLKIYNTLKEQRHSMNNLKYAQEILVEQAKLAALGSLVAGLAHEVNTPLGVAITATSVISTALNNIEDEIASGMVSRRSLKQEAQRAKDGLLLTDANLKRASTLIREFKRLTIDQASPIVGEVDLLSVINNLVFSLSPMCNEANIQLKVVGEPIILISEPSAIQQVLTNLIQNACVHPYENGGSVEVRLEADDIGAKITVQDWGIGMLPAISNRIFEPFFTTRRGDGGTGLGLYIAQNLMRGPLKGDIFVETELEHGTIFTLLILDQFNKTQIEMGEGI